jgi:hypothetical protein
MVNVSKFLTALCPNDGSAMRALAIDCRSSKGQAMRDFRDAKIMAHTLRAALAAKNFKITVSQSLELIAEVFGVSDWDTLAAAIRRMADTSGDTASSPPRGNTKWPSEFTREFELTLHRAQTDANEREHEFATLEHLLLALITDPDASAAMKANAADLQPLKDRLVDCIENDLKTLVTVDREFGATPSVAFRRVVYSAVAHVKSLNRKTTGADVLAAMFDQTESPAAWLLGEHGMTKESVANFIFNRDRQSKE